MRRSTATTAKPLTLAERKTALQKLVENGKLTERQAGLVDLRGLTAKEKEIGEQLARERRGKRAL